MSYSVDVAEHAPFGESMGQDKGNRSQESKEEGNGDPLVFGSNRVHVRRNRPRDGQGVELLDVLTRPDTCTLRGDEDVELVLDY